MLQIGAGDASKFEFLRLRILLRSSGSEHFWPKNAITVDIISFECSTLYHGWLDTACVLLWRSAATNMLLRGINYLYSSAEEVAHNRTFKMAADTRIGNRITLIMKAM